MLIDPDAEDSAFDCFEDDTLDVIDFYFVFGKIIWELGDIKLLTDFEVNNQECPIICRMELHFLSTSHLGSRQLQTGGGTPYKKNDEGAVLVPLRVLNLKRFTLRAFIVPVMSLSQKDL